MDFLLGALLIPYLYFINIASKNRRLDHRHPGVII
jgi:hypothetical protein